MRNNKIFVFIFILIRGDELWMEFIFHLLQGVYRGRGAMKAPAGVTLEVFLVLSFKLISLVNCFYVVFVNKAGLLKTFQRILRADFI